MIIKEILEVLPDLPKIFNKHTLTFDRKEKESEGIWSFYFTPEQNFTMRAGQHIMLIVPHEDTDSRKNMRFFSPSSAPGEDRVRVTMRYFSDQSSSYKRALFALEPGTQVTARGPLGRFTVQPEKTNLHLVFLAGGIGITPIRSILVDLDQRNVAINATLLYANRDENFTFIEEFKALEHKHEGFHTRKFVSPTHIDREDIQNAMQSEQDIFYIAGTPGFSNAFRKTLQDMGIPGKRIKADKFKPIAGGGGYA